MICTDCRAATVTQGCATQHDTPKCLYCTARLIQQIGKLRTPTSAQIVARRRAVLADAVAYGHNETVIRELAKSKTLAVQAVAVKVKRK
jgi:hypothetical protein